MIYQVEVENIIFKIFWFIKIKNIILASKSNLPYEINLPRPPHTKVVVFAILFLLIYSVFSGCKKIDSFSRERSPEEIEASFFAAKPGLPLPVLKVMEALKKQNTLGGFIPGLAKRDGYAVWEKSQVNRLNKIPTYNFNCEESDVVEVFTPIVQQDSNFVNGFFFSKIVGDSVELHLYRANDYDLYPFGNTDSTVVTAERITTKLHELNFNIFGPRGLKVRDTSLFSTIKPRDIFDSSIVILKGGYENNPSSFVSYACWYERSGLCDCGGPCDWNRPCPKMYFTNIRCVAILTNSGGGGAPVGWPPDPPISTGGGGSTPPSTGNCTSTTNCGQLRSLIVEGREPCGGCGPGPIIVVPLEDSPISQYQLDTQWMNDNIKDSSSNPCITGIIATLKHISPKLPQLMRSVFDTLDVVDFNMTVKVANLGSAIGGKTEFNILDSNFNVTVNSYFDDATDLAVVGTLIHEAFHCQLLDWYRTVMLNGDTVKRNYLALNYGYLFSKETTDYNNHLAAIIYGAQGASQHQDIATRYRNTIGETIYQYALSKGINVSLNYCKKLAWTGCQDSKAYLDLTQQEKDELTDIINAEKDPLGNNVNTSLKPFKGSPCL